MKILYLSPTYNSYSEVWQQRHIEMLQDHIFCIATLSSNEKLWKGKIPIRDLNPEIKLKTKISKYINKKHNNQKDIEASVSALIKKADVIFIQYLTFAERLYDVIKNTNKAVYVHTHGFDVTWNFRSHDNPSHNIHAPTYLERIKKFKTNVFFIANSKDTIKKLKTGGIQDQQIYLKYLGTEIYPERDKKNVVSDFNILYLGRLVDFKGPDMVIDAFNMACDRGLKANLIMAGDGPLRAMCEILKRKSKYSKYIQLLGPVSKEKADQLREAATVFIAHNCKGILSNQEEAFGVSIIEAMEAELPVISGANAGVNETVVHNKTGLLNTPFDVLQQAEYLLYLYKNPDIAQKMGKAGRAHVIDNFSYAKEKDNFLVILRERQNMNE